jgi:hypothetical protein
MTQMRTSILSIALLMLVATASAFGQNQTPPQPIEKPAAALSTKIEDVSKWTKHQWYAAKAKWIKEKEKWAGCEKQAVEKKLSGRKSWPFLYRCMISGA